MLNNVPPAPVDVFSGGLNQCCHPVCFLAVSRQSRLRLAVVESHRRKEPRKEEAGCDWLLMIVILCFNVRPKVRACFWASFPSLYSSFWQLCLFQTESRLRSVSHLLLQRHAGLRERNVETLVHSEAGWPENIERCLFSTRHSEVNIIVLGLLECKCSCGRLRTRKAGQLLKVTQ